MNPLLQALLAALQNQQQPQQQDPMQQLVQLLGNQGQQQDPTQQLMALLGQSNQQPANNAGAQLAALLGGQPNSQQPTGTAFTSEQLKQITDALMSAGGGANNQTSPFQQALSGGMTEKEKQEKIEAMVKMEQSLDKFCEDHKQYLPQDFDLKNIKDIAAKHCDGVEARTQAIVATISKEIFKNESFVNSLEERDREYLANNLLNTSERAVDREKAFELMTRASFNISRADGHAAIPNQGASDPVIEAYGARFSLGMQPTQAQQDK